MSIAYYDANAQKYFDETVAADMRGVRERFLQHVAMGGTILDAGCGSGRDAKAFDEAGYRVSAFDASGPMVELARQYTGLDVQHMVFADMAWHNAFDGIWASASLLHVPRDDLPNLFGKFALALRANGAWFLAMKHGDQTRCVDGRVFTDVTEPEICGLVQDAGLSVAEIWFSHDVRPGRSDRWINVIAEF